MRPGLVVVVVALVASLSAACQSDDDPSPSSSPPSSSSPSPSPSPSGQAIEYVALGDSYTAAPLVPTTDVAQSCLRSTGNYPHLVAAQRPEIRLLDVSCSGADTTDMTGRQSSRGQTQEPQLDAVSAETDLVTIGIGANDFRFFGSLAVSCLQLAETDPKGSPCRRNNGGAAGTNRLLDRLPRIQQRIMGVIGEVRERAPDATVVVVNYPQILPKKGTCPSVMPLADGDYAFLDEVNEALSDAVLAAAEESGVVSVDVYAASRGHDVCSDEPWVNGVITDPGQALALHPFAAEQQAVAELILDEL